MLPKKEHHSWSLMSLHFYISWRWCHWSTFRKGRSPIVEPREPCSAYLEGRVRGGPVIVGWLLTVCLMGLGLPSVEQTCLDLPTFWSAPGCGLGYPCHQPLLYRPTVADNIRFSWAWEYKKASAVIWNPGPCLMAEGRPQRKELFPHLKYLPF